MVVRAMAPRLVILASVALIAWSASLSSEQLRSWPSQGEDEVEQACFMETAPWRVARRWADTGAASSGPPAMLTHSTRSFPTAEEHRAERDRTLPPETEAPSADGMGPDAAHNGESQEAFLTEEDIQNFEQLPTAPTQQECRLLWAGLLELQDEEAMREDTDTALSNGTAALPSASRHLCRIRKLIQGRSMTGLARLAVALPCVLQGIQETVAEEIEQGNSAQASK